MINDRLMGLLRKRVLLFEPENSDRRGVFSGMYAIGLSRRSALAMLGSSMLAGCGFLGKDLGTYRFRLTLSVNTPEGVREASGVMEASYGLEQVIGRGEVSNHRLKGEAVFLDLGNARNLVMLLVHGPRGADVNQMAWLPTTALLKKPWGMGSAEALAEGLKLEGSVELIPALIPTIVTFSDLNNPATAQIVYATGVGPQDRDPLTIQPKREQYAVIDTISETFGSGYSFRGVTLKMVSAGIWPLNYFGITGQQVTSGIEKHLTWLSKPLPWLKSNNRGAYIDTRPQDSFRLNIEHLKRVI